MSDTDTKKLVLAGALGVVIGIAVMHLPFKRKVPKVNIVKIEEEKIEDESTINQKR